jgi:hypothetical protein
LLAWTGVKAVQVRPESVVWSMGGGPLGASPPGTQANPVRGLTKSSSVSRAANDIPCRTAVQVVPPSAVVSKTLPMASDGPVGTRMPSRGPKNVIRGNAPAS